MTRKTFDFGFPPNGTRGGLIMYNRKRVPAAGTGGQKGWELGEPYLKFQFNDNLNTYQPPFGAKRGSA